MRDRLEMERALATKGSLTLFFFPAKSEGGRLRPLEGMAAGFFLLSFGGGFFKVAGCPRRKDKRKYLEGLPYPPGFAAVPLSSLARES